jgi:hypothetical protein
MIVICSRDREQYPMKTPANTYPVWLKNDSEDGGMLKDIYDDV